MRGGAVGAGALCAAAVARPAAIATESASSVGCRRFSLRPPCCWGADLLLGKGGSRSETEQRKQTNPGEIKPKQTPPPPPQKKIKTKSALPVKSIIPW